MMPDDSPTVHDSARTTEVLSSSAAPLQAIFVQMQSRETLLVFPGGSGIGEYPDVFLS